MRAARAWMRLGAVAAALLLWGCPTEAPQLQPLPPDGVVLAFGDSLTRGTGARVEESYPARLGELLGRQVVNAGVPGELSAAGARRLPGVLSQVRPVLVVLCHGGNDLLRNQDLSETEENLQTMIRAVQAAGAEVVLLGVPEPRILMRVPRLYGDLAGQFGIPYDGEVLRKILRDPAMKSDPIHPNAAGYAHLAGAVRDLLVEAGAVF